MRSTLSLLLASLTLLVTRPAQAADESPTLMTVRGKLLASEDFAQPLAPFTGKPVGFASGFSGWRYNVGTKGGHWEVTNGVFTGSEIVESHHPATASFGLQFKDAIVQCDVRLSDVPAAGRQYRSLFLKATDAKDYVCALFVGPGGLNAQPYDDTRINPTTKQREKGPVKSVRQPIQLGEWHTLVLEIKGEEAVCSLDGKSVTFSHPLLGTDKHSVMLGAGTEASFRHLRIWEALPNPDWPQHKQTLSTAVAPEGKK